MKIVDPTIRNGAGLTLTEFADAKKLDRRRLEKWGLKDVIYGGQPALRIPYADAEGYECAVRFRTAMTGDRFRWKKGDKPNLYGLWRLKRMRPRGYLVVSEGESDTLTLWSQEFPALGLPSATTWDDKWGAYLADFQKIFFVIEPDRGGQAVLGRLLESPVHPNVRLVRLDGVKDPSELYLGDPANFRSRFQKVLDQAVRWSPEKQGTQAGISRPKESQASQLVGLIDPSQLFHTQDGKPYATIAVGDHLEHWSVKSTPFKRLLYGKFYESQKSVVKAQVLQDALNVLAGKALFEGEERPIFTRVAEYEGKLYVDLADQRWRAVEISGTRWSLVGNPPVRFRRAGGMAPLPEPVQGGEIRELKQFINLSSTHDRILVLSWLIAALGPQGPYPVLALHGEQGSGKSTAARILRSLVDPSTAAVRSAPRDARDLMIAATNSHVMSFDNLSYLPDWLSDGLCRLATGGGFATRQLYSDDEEIIFDAMRPILLNGIGELTSRSDLMERTILIYLPEIPKSERLPEKIFWRQFEAAKSRIFGALLTALSAALCKAKSVHVNELPRMADFAISSIAAETALGFKNGAFMSAYSRNRKDASAVVLESSSIAGCIRGLLKVNDRISWSGTATQLLEDLSSLRGNGDHGRNSWPRTPSGLSAIIRRLSPNFRAAGISIDFQRLPGTGERLITIRRET